MDRYRIAALVLAAALLFAAATDYVPLILKSAGKSLDVIGAHDYDPRGDRWGALRRLAGSRPVWLTEWCARGKDGSGAHFPKGW